MLTQPDSEGEADEGITPLYSPLNLRGDEGGLCFEWLIKVTRFQE